LPRAALLGGQHALEALFLALFSGQRGPISAGSAVPSGPCPARRANTATGSRNTIQPMKKPIDLPSAGVGALLSVALLALTSGRQPRQESAAPQAWEYQPWGYFGPHGFLCDDNGDLRTYNSYGAEGWEYAGITKTRDGHDRPLWKRPKKAK
jgi:hypothetical protein